MYCGLHILYKLSFLEANTNQAPKLDTCSAHTCLCWPLLYLGVEVLLIPDSFAVERSDNNRTCRQIYQSASLNAPAYTCSCKIYLFLFYSHAFFLRWWSVIRLIQYQFNILKHVRAVHWLAGSSKIPTPWNAPRWINQSTLTFWRVQTTVLSAGPKTLIWLSW